MAFFTLTLTLVITCDARGGDRRMDYGMVGYRGIGIASNSVDSISSLLRWMRMASWIN